MDLGGRVALITGGGSGMGRAAAERLASEGMRVCVVDINGDAAQDVAGAIEGLAVKADVSDPREVEAAFAACVERFGGVDLAYANAGVAAPFTDIAVLDDAAYRRVVGVNLDGVVFGVRAAVRAMRKGSEDTAHGVIIATSSIAGLEPFYPDPIYTLTKHAVVGFIRSLAPNLAAEGIATHAICPSVTDTGMLSEETKKTLQAIGIPLVKAEQIADVVVRVATLPLEESGSCWVCHADQPALPFAFNDVPGPHSILNVHR